MEGHICLVEEEASVDNLRYLGGELRFWDMNLFGSLAMDLGSSGEDFDIRDIGIVTQEGVLGSLTAR